MNKTTDLQCDENLSQLRQQQSTFGDTESSIQTTVPDPDIPLAFGAVRTSDGALMLMVVNKDIKQCFAPFLASITNFNAVGTVQRWQRYLCQTISHLQILPSQMEF